MLKDPCDGAGTTSASNLLFRLCTFVSRHLRYTFECSSFGTGTRKVLLVTFSHVYFLHIHYSLPCVLSEVPILEYSSRFPHYIATSIHRDVLVIVRWLPSSTSRFSSSSNDAPWSKKPKLEDIRQSTLQYSGAAAKETLLQKGPGGPGGQVEHKLVSSTPFQQRRPTTACIVLAKNVTSRPKWFFPSIQHLWDHIWNVSSYFKLHITWKVWTYWFKITEGHEHGEAAGECDIQIVEITWPVQA